MSILEFDGVYLSQTSVIVGPKEGKCIYKDYFDNVLNDLILNEKSFESAEIKMLHQAIDLVLKKSGLNEFDIDVAFGGELINQDVISNYTYCDYQIPFVGLYSACATSVLSIILASIYLTMRGKNVLISGSSHNATSERQFRYPNEYGGPRPDTQTLTVTASYSAIISKSGYVKIKRALIGKVIDVDFKYISDMGRAMGPACVESIIEFLSKTNTKPKDYDLILTGDLSKYGESVVLELLEQVYGPIDNYDDCGLMIYRGKKGITAGGSGPACMPSIAFSYVFNKLKKGEFKRVLLCATGALMNSTMSLQGKSVPAICHIIELEGEL